MSGCQPRGSRLYPEMFSVSIGFGTGRRRSPARGGPVYSKRSTVVRLNRADQGWPFWTARRQMAHQPRVGVGERKKKKKKVILYETTTYSFYIKNIFT